MLWNFSNPLNAAILHWYSRVKTFGNDLGDQALLVGFQLLNLSLDIGCECIDICAYSIKTFSYLFLYLSVWIRYEKCPYIGSIKSASYSITTQIIENAIIIHPH